MRESEYIITPLSLLSFSNHRTFSEYTVILPEKLIFPFKGAPFNDIDKAHEEKSYK